MFWEKDETKKLLSNFFFLCFKIFYHISKEIFLILRTKDNNKGEKYNELFMYPCCKDVTDFIRHINGISLFLLTASGRATRIQAAKSA